MALSAKASVRKAHAWCNFDDLREAWSSALTSEALLRIGELYVIEAEIRGKPTDERRGGKPGRNRWPLTLNADCAARSKSSPVNPIHRRRSFALNLWPALSRNCKGGMIEIDNSAAERALRGLAIGRRNYLFAGADTGGERAAATNPLIRTTKLNGVAPEVCCAMRWRTSPITLSIALTSSCPALELGHVCQVIAPSLILRKRRGYTGVNGFAKPKSAGATDPITGCRQPAYWSIFSLAANRHVIRRWSPRLSAPRPGV